VKALKDIVCISTTDAAASEAAFQGIPHANSAETEQVRFLLFLTLFELD